MFDEAGYFDEENFRYQQQYMLPYETTICETQSTGPTLIPQKRREMTNEDMGFVTKIMNFSKNNPEWALNLLDVMFNIEEENMEVEHYIMNKTTKNVTHIKPLDYAAVLTMGASNGNSKYYRGKHFLGFCRFTDDKNNPDETYENRVKRVVTEVLTPSDVILQIVIMMMETNPEKVIIEMATKNNTKFRELLDTYAYIWVRLAIHQLWVGKFREKLSHNIIQNNIKVFGLKLRDATPYEDKQQMFDKMIETVEGKPVLGLSCKSPRYAQQYRTHSYYRDGNEKFETLGHTKTKKKYGVDVVVYITDHNTKNMGEAVKNIMEPIMAALMERKTLWEN